MNSLSKKVELQKNKIVVTETKEISLTDGTEIEDLKRKLRVELVSIVLKVKSLKARADEIKGMLEEIEKLSEETQKVKMPNHTRGI